MCVSVCVFVHVVLGKLKSAMRAFGASESDVQYSVCRVCGRFGCGADGRSPLRHRGHMAEEDAAMDPAH